MNETTQLVDLIKAYWELGAVGVASLFIFGIYKRKMMLREDHLDWMAYQNARIAEKDAEIKELRQSISQLVHPLQKVTEHVIETLTETKRR